MKIHVYLQLLSPYLYGVGVEYLHGPLVHFSLHMVSDYCHYPCCSGQMKSMHNAISPNLSTIEEIKFASLS